MVRANEHRKSADAAVLRICAIDFIRNANPPVQAMLQNWVRLLGFEHGTNRAFHHEVDQKAQQK
jgi:hypothetical protein